ncbi:MAG: gluconate 2-dehydrogenase subunit 3 family protein [Haloarculaceae archaeon]
MGERESADGEARLTRRDALAALASAGIVVGGAGALTWRSLRGTDEAPAFSSTDRRTLEAIARVVYPSVAENVGEFVETYVVGRIQDRPEYAASVRDAVADLDESARYWEDESFADLDPATGSGLLESLGIDQVEADPDGDDAERIRFYLVNELLFAFYASPTGGELLGIENPPGYPGGTRSYQRGPDEPDGRR